jgi:hypothetical protein
LVGQQLRVLFERRYEAGGLSLCCEGGPLGSVMLPVDWTDRGKPAAAGAVGYEELVELAGLVRALATRGRSEVVDCQWFQPECLV